MKKPKSPILTVDGIFLKNGKVLLVRQNKYPFLDSWVLHARLCRKAKLEVLLPASKAVRPLPKLAVDSKASSRTKRS